MKKYGFLLLLITACWLFSSQHAEAQKLSQLSGLVVTGEEQLGVAGISIYVPGKRRGTVSNAYGYFSLPVLAGDSLLITGLGFKKQYYKVPDDGREGISVLIYVDEDTLFTPVVELTPYATEELFKEAFLALKLPERDYNAMRNNLEEQKLAMMRFNMPNDGSTNHQYFVEGAAIKQDARTYQPTVQLTNPFAWREFIRSIKRGDLKKKDYRQPVKD